VKRTLQGITVAALTGIALFAGREWGRADETTAKSEKVFELRIYHANEGKLDDLNARFRDHTTKLFAKHGIENIGYWVPTDGEAAKNTLYYIVAHPSREAAKENWKAFINDPDWKAAAKKSEENGKLVGKLESVYMKPVDYSPIK
jgi:hypothetical protein